MNILVFDLEIYENDIFDIVETYLGDISFTKTRNEDMFFSLFDRYNYDLILIDVSHEVGERIFQNVTTLNNQQKILVLSKTVTYSGDLSCSMCANKYNRKLLLKPIKANDLINYVQNYDELLCKYSSESNEIVEILADIMEQFIYYIYDQNKRMISSKNKRNNTREFIDIVELLNVHKIEYIIHDDNIHLLNLEK